MTVRQRGVALITALILLALATMLAVTIGFESAMTARRSAASFSMEQSLQLAQGAEALAAYVLREDKNTTDSPSDSWSQPYGPVEVVPEVSLEAQLFDEQGKFNVNTLVKADGTVDENARMIFARLLELLEIEPRWTSLLIDWLDSNNEPETEGGEDSLYLSQTPPYRPANISITSVSEIAQLPGLGRERYLKLLPHVTALPPDAAQINVCTADGFVLDALFALSKQNTNDVVYSRIPLDELAKFRAKDCFPRLTTIAPQSTEPEMLKHAAEKTQYFQLRTWLRIGFAEFALYSLMYRDVNGQARPVARTFGTE